MIARHSARAPETQPARTLHDISPIVSNFCVTRNVEAPARAAAAAASQPAWPPPITTTSACRMEGAAEAEVDAARHTDPLHHRAPVERCTAWLANPRRSAWTLATERFACADSMPGQSTVTFPCRRMREERCLARVCQPHSDAHAWVYCSNYGSLSHQRCIQHADAMPPRNQPSAPPFTAPPQTHRPFAARSRRYRRRWYCS